MFDKFILIDIYISGDIITEVDGQPVKGVRDVLDALGLEVGRVMEIKVNRPSGASGYQTGDTITFRVTTAVEK
jgi:S1-C subfamily serine protease